MRKKENNMEAVGFFLITIAIFLFILGSLLIFFSRQKTRVEGSGIILIGPFPIIFGTSYQAILTSLILLTIFLILFFIFMFTLQSR
ncbi:MAG: TIGR00304 family membrane protein [Candidatus Aenigmatarchaeota archaeon]